MGSRSPSGTYVHPDLSPRKTSRFRFRTRVRLHTHCAQRAPACSRTRRPPNLAQISLTTQHSPGCPSGRCVCLRCPRRATSLPLFDGVNRKGCLNSRRRKNSESCAAVNNMIIDHNRAEQQRCTCDFQKRYLVQLHLSSLLVQHL